jgi:hypothetical protein
LFRVESDFFLVLDSVLEGADRLITCDFDREYIAGIISLDKKAEFEYRTSERRREGNMNYMTYC